MTIDDTGASLIKEFEGCELNAYDLHDGKITIGYGNTFYEDNTPVKMGDTITQERAGALFLLIVPQFEQAVNRVVTSEINQNQFNALVSFTYNLGAGNLNSSTLLKKVNANPNDHEIIDEFMKWVMPGSKFEAGLRKRRLAEADLYFS